MAQNMSDILGRMVLFDQVHRMGSSSSNGSLELEFFRAFRGRLQACVGAEVENGLWGGGGGGGGVQCEEFGFLWASRFIRTSQTHDCRSTWPG